MLAWISYTPVKGLGMLEPEAADLTEHGLAGDRTFYLINARGQLTNSRRAGSLHQVKAGWDARSRELELRFPGGEVVADRVQTDGDVTTDFYGRPVTGRLVTGPFADALSEFAGVELRLVEALPAGSGIDRGREGTVTILSLGSLERLAQVAGVEHVDRRRFRMSLGVEGVEPHAEDGWIGRQVRVGEAVVRPTGNVGRCVITTRDPDTGERTLDTLGAISSYRDDVASSEKLPFGVYGQVVAAGRVRMGDPVELLER